MRARNGLAGESRRKDGFLAMLSHVSRVVSGRIRLDQTTRPDVVLLDIGLPGLDGYEIARRLRTLPLDETRGGETFRGRIIAVTGYGRDSDIARAREAGFDAHL